MVSQTNNQSQASSQSRWLILILMILLLLLAIYLSGRPDQLSSPQPIPTNPAACASDGYTAVYFPFKGSPYQIITLDQISLAKFLDNKSRYGNRALQDISSLTCLEQLQILNTGDTKITDLSPLTKLIHLQEFMLDGSSVTDLSPLRHLPQLTMLQIFNSPISQLPDLSNLKNLSTLSVCNRTGDTSTASSNDLLDISAIGQITSLQNLSLCLDRPTDLTPLSTLKKLQELRILGDWPQVAYNTSSAQPASKFPPEIRTLQKALPQTKIYFGER